MKLPYLAVEEKFSSRSVVIHDHVVAAGGMQFLVSAHYSPEGPINGALKQLLPGFEWRGELIVVALGKTKPYIARMKKLEALTAVNMSVFLATHSKPLLIIL